MPMIGPRIIRALSLSVALASAGFADAGFFSVAWAARAAPDQFPLGQSAQSGAVCEAVRNDDAPGAQARGARAWDVQCRGWDAPLGTLYAYSYQGAKAVAPDGVFTKALDKTHIRCAAGTPVQVPGIGAAMRAECKAFEAKVGYTIYQGTFGGRTVAAEGYPQMSDVLEAGLRVVGGVMAPPKPTQTLPAATVSSGGESLVEASDAAARAPEKLRDRGYNQNISWDFTNAETDFRSLAEDPNALDKLRAEAYLNWALNTSNNGNFDQAKLLFERADRLAGADRALRGLSLGYRALDFRNQRKFKESIAAAEEARKVFAELQMTEGDGPAAAVEVGPGNDVLIPPTVALKLKGRSNTFDSSSVDTNSKLRVRIAQVELTEATSEDALGHTARARALLEDAHAILNQAEIAGLEPWLDAQLDAEMARQDEAAGRTAEAQARLNLALTELRRHQAGSPAEAFLLMDIARLDVQAGRRDQAIGDYQAAIALFRQSRGTLGSSADSIAPYLDLLIAQTKADPAHAADYADRFMTAVQSIGSLTTAQVVAKLSAKLAQNDKVAGGLVRGYEDTRREVRAKESEIAQLQSQGLYTPAKKAESEAEIKVLKDQEAELFSRVLATDPKYGQRITADVSLKDLQAALKPGELYLKVSLITTQGYVLAVTADSATPYRIDLGKAAAGTLVEHLRKPFETEGYLPRFDVAQSHALYTRLFSPIEDQLTHAKLIVYEPDATLLAMPIAALVTDKASVDLMAARRKAARARGEADAPYDSVHWLGRTAETSLVVSAASFVQARKFTPSAGKHAFLGFGDPQLPTSDNPRAFRSVTTFTGADAGLCEATKAALFDLQPLKETGSEIKAVGDSINPADAAIVTGEAFSDSAVEGRKDLDQYRVLFFATHGLLPTKKDCLPEPALLTSVGPDTSEGLLSASKIAGLTLDADLVVLSACDTGGGLAAGIQDRTGLAGSGEALSGLTRAFIYAGARSLIVSHWSVDVHAMVGLMTSMFASGEPTLSGALRDADLKMMDSGDQYSHPYYWAAFTVVGDGARPMPAR